jgi:hypothetical protein
MPGPTVQKAIGADLPRFDNGPVARARRFLKKHGRKLWWLHSLYALGIGVSVVAFAQKGFDHARWLSISLAGAWLIVLLFFRVYGSGSRQSTPDMTGLKGKLRFYAMTYALKNLYQGMLFFLLPFYWKSATLDAYDAGFVVLLAGCAVISTLDIVFDRFLMKWRVLASTFHGIILFGCLNLVIPALFPDTRTLYSLLAAAGIAVVGFFTLHVPLRALVRWYNLALLAGCMGAGVAGVYLARRGVPPVPMYVTAAAVGPQLIDDKSDPRLAMEVRSVQKSFIHQLYAVTDVSLPGGKGDRLRHVWRHDGTEVFPFEFRQSALPHHTIRLQSQVKRDALPKDLSGHWSVDVETEDGQLVGRASFNVYD